MPEEMDRADQAHDDAAAALGRFLRDHREEILERWVEATRAEGSIRDLDERRLVDHLPVILDEVAEAVEAAGGGQPVEEPSHGPAAHAMHRHHQGFTLRELVSEYRILRRCLLSLCCERASHLLAVTVEVVNEALDLAVERSVTRFTQERERALQTLDELAEAGLGAASLDELLRALLRSLVERVKAVDGASLFVREGDRLRLRASAGLAEERADLTLAVGQGLAGTVAARREPHLVRSAATDPLVKSEIYRRHGVRALYGVPLADERGEVVGVATIASLTASDFSDEDKLLVRTLTRRATALIVQHLLREAAEERTTRLRHAEQLMSVHPDSFSIVDPSHRITWANPALLRRWGRTRLNDVVGRRLEELGYTPVVAESLRGELDRVFRGETVQSVAAYTSPSGRTGVYEYVIAPVTGEGGRVEAAAAVTRDVSDRFRAEQARADALVRERSAREEAEQTVALLDSLLAGSPAGLAFVDSRLRYVRINEAMAAVNGLPAKDHVGRHIRDVLPGDAAALEPLMRRVLETGESVVNLEIEARPPSTPSELRAFLGNFFPVRLPGGDVIGVGVVCMEITDRKRMEEELRRAVQVRERVMGILGHDLRGPLSVVMASAGLLRRSEVLGDQELRTVARITRASNRMTRMIRDLLDYARASGGGLPIDRRPADLRTVTREVMDEVRAAFPGCNLRLEAEDHACEGVWDPDRLAQLLTNLVSNAVQYSPPGSPVDLRIRCEDPDRTVVEVHNSGAPIPPEVLPSLFEPFQRGLAAEATSPGGLGLGLYIVKQIADGHGGTVGARSSAVEGTTFVVDLPRR